MSHPKYRTLVQDITDGIANGTFPPGERIPSTAELCASYKVSATVVNQAVLVLESRGLIEGVPGVGRFVKAPK